MKIRHLLIACLMGIAVLGAAGVARAEDVRMFVRHEVSDYGAWRKVFDAFAPMQKKQGVVYKAVYQSTDDPNDVTVIHDFHSLDLIVGAPVGDPRCAIYERLEVALSTGDCEVFEHVAASVHDGNYGTSERLTEQQGRGHGNEGDSIDAHASGEETPHHR
jgi:hypothetical protein